MSKDPIAEIIGDVGKWQIQRILLLFIISLPGLALIFSVPFVFNKTDFWCDRNIDDNINSQNATLMDAKQLENNTVKNQCMDDCKNYIFDATEWTKTLIMEWEMVCHRNHLQVIVKTAIFGGFAVGTFGAGWISDTYGRKTAIILMSQLLFGAGMLASVMTNIISFTILWFLTGIASIGVFTVCFVWCMESVSGKWKTIIGMSMAFAWQIASLIMVGIGGGFRDWRRILQATSVLHIATPLLANYFPESPKWLFATNVIRKEAELRLVLKNAAQINGKYNEYCEKKIEALFVTKEESIFDKDTKDKFVDTLRHPKLLVRILILYWNWFTNAFIIYGLGLNWKELTGNLIYNLIIGSCIGIVARILTIGIVTKIGRKLPYIVCLFGAGLSFLCMIPFKKGDYVFNWPIVTCAMFGYFFIACSFAIIWVYTSELFPTNARNAGVGSCSFIARIGGVTSIYVGLLAETNVVIPYLMFATSALISATITFGLPETGGKKLPDTIEDCKNQSSCTDEIRSCFQFRKDKIKGISVL